jgi:hypothetical protein
MRYYNADGNEAGCAETVRVASRVSPEVYAPTYKL